MSRCAAHTETLSITCPECYILEKYEVCKKGKCGLHCNSYSDIDWGKDGCQWCEITSENERFTHLINKQTADLDRAVRTQEEDRKLIRELLEGVCCVDSSDYGKGWADCKEATLQALDAEFKVRPISKR